MMERRCRQQFLTQCIQSCMSLLIHGSTLGLFIIINQAFQSWNFRMINSNGEFYDLEKKLNKTRDPQNVDGKCSGFVKVSDFRGSFEVEGYIYCASFRRPAN